MRTSLAVCSICVFVFAASAGASPMNDPFGYFNVYSLGDIGSAGAKYHSDFQGVAGAAGDVYFSSFSLHGNDSAGGYCLHTGGSATLTGAYLKGLEIGGDAALGSLSVGGSVVAGGDIANFSGGSIAGDAQAGGSVQLSQAMTVSGQKRSGAAFVPLVDHDMLSKFFRDTSAAIGAMPDTGAVANQWGLLSFDGTSGVNVVSVDAATLRSAWGFTIRAPADAVVYVNVPDADVQLDWTGWGYTGGVSAGNVILNLPNAEALQLTSANAVNVLAPLAETYFPAGLITGSLVVGDLEGGGQVNLGHFEQGPPVPEPATLWLFAASAAGLVRRARRRRSGDRF